jgi:hypothetical protein
MFTKALTLLVSLALIGLVTASVWNSYSGPSFSCSCTGGGTSACSGLSSQDTAAAQEGGCPFTSKCSQGDSAEESPCCSTGSSCCLGKAVVNTDKTKSEKDATITSDEDLDP